MALRASWESKHETLQHSKVPAMLNRPALKVSACYHAGFCFCGGETTTAPNPPLAKALERVLRSVLAKVKGVPRTPERCAYQRNFLFFDIYETSPGAEPMPQLWAHIGMGNLSDYSFTFIRMDALVLREVQTVLKWAANRPEGLVEFLHDVPTTSDLDVELLLLDGSRNLVNLPFTGGMAKVKPF